MYQATTQQQNSGFQSQQPQSYAMEIHAVRLTPVQNQPQSVQIATLNDQSAVNTNQIPAITAVQNLVTVQHNFPTQAVNSQLQTQHQAIRSLPSPSLMSSKPYKIVQPQQQCYKFPNLVQNLNAQQCTNSFKVTKLRQRLSNLTSSDIYVNVVYFSDASHATSGIGFFDGATVAVTDIAAV